MASRRSYYIAGLALLPGTLCLLPPGALAGDKIDFSAPAMTWNVPQREVEQKDKAPAPAPGFSSYQPAEMVPLVEETTVVVTRSREMEKHAWDSHAFDSRLSLMPDKDKSKLSVLEQLLEPETETTETNDTAGAKGSRDFGRDPNANNPNEPRSRKDEDKKDSSTDQFHSDHGDTALFFGGDQERKEEHFGDEYAKSLGTVPWMKGSDDDDQEKQDQSRRHELDRMRHGDFVTISPDERNSFDMSGAAISLDGANGSMDPLHSSSSPGMEPAYSNLPGGLGTGEAFAPPPAVSAWDTGSAAEAPAYTPPPAAPQPSWSSGIQASEPSARLPFPHRPGSPFQ